MDFRCTFSIPWLVSQSHRHIDWHEWIQHNNNFDVEKTLVKSLRSALLSSVIIADVLLLEKPSRLLLRDLLLLECWHTMSLRKSSFFYIWICERYYSVSTCFYLVFFYPISAFGFIVVGKFCFYFRSIFIFIDNCT